MTLFDAASATSTIFQLAQCKSEALCFYESFEVGVLTDQVPEDEIRISSALLLRPCFKISYANVWLNKNVN